MKTARTKPKDIDDYIAGFPAEVQPILEKVRATIRKAAPKAEETISYQIPTFKLNGAYLIYFAAFKEHVGLYPVPPGNAELDPVVKKYRSGQATLRFPYDEALPLGLITRIVKLKAKASLERGKARPSSRATGSSSRAK